MKEMMHKFFEQKWGCYIVFIGAMLSFYKAQALLAQSTILGVVQRLPAAKCAFDGFGKELCMFLL